MSTQKALPVFDELVQLRGDPEAFEKRRKEILEETFSTMPEELQRRMRLQQWSLEQQLERIKNPTERFNRMVALFWEGFGRFQDAVNGNVPEPKPKCEVIKLEERR